MKRFKKLPTYLAGVGVWLAAFGLWYSSSPWWLNVWLLFVWFSTIYCTVGEEQQRQLKRYEDLARRFSELQADFLRTRAPAPKRTKIPIEFGGGQNPESN